uniref:WAT1-related protein n=1 Tax=Oryza brachyantha TaxID=4533 RepID=J3KTY3_ORYBR
MAETMKTTTERRRKPWMAEWVLLPTSMVVVQLFTIGALILAKLSFNVGMAPFVLLAYRNLAGAIVVLPFGLWLERNYVFFMKKRPIGPAFYQSMVTNRVMLGMSSGEYKLLAKEAIPI